MDLTVIGHVRKVSPTTSDADPSIGGPWGRSRNQARARESSGVDAVAVVLGLAVGLAAGPVADRMATNGPAHRPLLSRTPTSPWVVHVTAATAVLGAACGLAFGFTPEAAIGAFVCVVLVTIARADLETHLIPNRIVIPATVVLLVARTIDDPSLQWVLGALGAGVALFLIVLAYPKGMGMGDVKLAAFMGAALGGAVVLALFVGFLASAVPAIVLLVRHGSAARKRAIPLGPFLALGGIVALFFGDAVIDWYRGVTGL